MTRRTRFLILAAVVAPLLAFSGPAGAVNANDPAYTQGLQWGLTRIHAADAWTKATGKGVTIAVVDSGIDLSHEDLAGKIVASTSCVSSAAKKGCSGSAQDDNGHGTHVAGIAAAATGNGKGVAGVAPDASLMIVRALVNTCDSTGCEASGYVADVAAGIRWAADHGANVINLSLGSSVDSITGTSLGDALEYAWGKGAVPVVAAGNDYVLPSAYSNQHAIVVAATNRDDAKAVYSQGTNNLIGTAMWGVAAPGGEGGDTKESCATGGTPLGVLSTYFLPGKSNQYACLAGTSMAAPHVSGAVALLLSQGLSPQQAVDRLLATADDLGPKGKDSDFGSGRINLARAVGAGAGAGTTTTTTRSGGGTPTTKPAGGSGTTNPSVGSGATTTLPVVTTNTSPASNLGDDGATAAAHAGNLRGTSDRSSSGNDAKPVLLVLVAVAAVLGAGGGTAWWLFLGARQV